MKATILNPKFKTIFSLLTSLISEGQLIFTEDKMRIVCMDPANVAMVIIKLKKDFFLDYEAKAETRFALNFHNLKQVLKRASADDVLEITPAENKMCINIKGKINRSFKVPLLEWDKKDQKIPPLDFTASGEMESELLSLIVDDASIASESILLTIDKGNKILNIKGSTFDTAGYEMELGDKDIRDFKFTGEELRTKYSLEYLRKMITGAKISPLAHISFGTDYPLRLSYYDEQCQITYILAPRVDNY